MTRTLITGGTSNIGLGIAERLAADGHTLVVGYRSDGEAAEAAVARLRELGATAHAVQADVSTPDGARALFDGAAEALGRPPEAVVHSAGVTPTPAPLADTDDDEIDRLLSANVAATAYVLREAARRVPDGGRVVAVSSAVSLGRPPQIALYGATKALSNALVTGLAKELGERDITVNAVLPGPTTDDPPDNESASDEAQLSVFGRFGRPADIAAAVAFLVGPDGGWVTGATIPVSGGAFL